METKNYKELPFDLEAAKVHPDWVYTRDGRKVRIICADRDFPLPIVALVRNSDGDAEFVERYAQNGDGATKGDSLILRVTEIKTKIVGWANIYNNPKGMVAYIYPTKEDAMEAGLKMKSCKTVVDTVKIEWEEE